MKVWRKVCGVSVGCLDGLRVIWAISLGDDIVILSEKKIHSLIFVFSFIDCPLAE